MRIANATASVRMRAGRCMAFLSWTSDTFGLGSQAVKHDGVTFR